MPHGTTPPDEMADQNDTPSFVTGSSTKASNKKSNGSNGSNASNGSSGSNGNNIGANFAAISAVWGTPSNNIWSTGNTNYNFAARAVTRDSSALREVAPQDSTSASRIPDRQTGSRSLADSSVSDVWSSRSNTAASQPSPPARSTTYTRYTEPYPFQQRSTSNAGPPPLSTVPANSSSWSSRPPPINLSATSSMHPTAAFASSYTQRLVNRGAEPPPTVYTKFDRPSDPNARTAGSAESSALSGYSPTDTRRSGVSTQFSNRTFSQGTSRDSSNQPSGFDTPYFQHNDYKTTSQGPTQSSSRAPSISSQYNGNFNSIQDDLHADLDAVAQRLDQCNKDEYGRPTSSQPPLRSSHGPWPVQAALPINGPSPSRIYWNSIDASADTTDREESAGSFGRPYSGFGLDRSVHVPYATPGPSSAPSRQRGSIAHTPSAPVFTPGQPYVGTSSLSGCTYGLRTNPYREGSSAMQRFGTHSALGNEQEYVIDPHTHQFVPVPRLGSYEPYIPYGVIQPLGHRMFADLHMVAADAAIQHEEGSGRQGVQSALMYEFRNNPKGRRYELRDIYDHIAEFSGDQHGSRFIQTKLETANSDEKEQVFRELEPNAMALMVDVFGNYVIQKFFEHGDQLQKKMLAAKMRNQVMYLSSSMYGCRVVQKALDVVLADQQAEIISELKGNVIACVQNQNGNHVIQKAIEKCRPEHIAFIFAAFRGEVRALSTHAYGCRVIQRCLERCEDDSKAKIMSELADGIEGMIMDQFGNYVVQHVVEHDQGESRRRVLDIVAKNLEVYSKHKFASNVVEKCLVHADDLWKRNIWLTIARAPLKVAGAEGDGLFVGLIKDLFGNYVIQKLLDTLGPDDYYHFVDSLHPALMHAKRTGGSSGTKQVQVIEKKLQDRIKRERDDQAKRSFSNGIYNPNVYRAPLGTPQWRKGNSTTHTPSPPPPQFRGAAQALQPTNMPGNLNGSLACNRSTNPNGNLNGNLNHNLNGDATEGASSCNIRRSNGF